MQTTSYSIPGIGDAAGARAVAAAFETVPGMHSIQINSAHARATVRYDEALATPMAMRAALAQAGFTMQDEPAASSCCGGCGG